MSGAGPSAGSARPAVHRRRARGAAVLLLPLLAAACGGCGAAGPEAPGLAEARGHLERLTAFGPRPSGSEANRAAARYLVETLGEQGWEVTLQEGVGTNRRAATAGRVRNVVAWLPAAPAAPAGPPAGGTRDAVLFAAHYDSVVDGPGAMDNAASVAAVLVATRKLAGTPRRVRPAVVLLSDGEERYLLGADLFVRESPLADRVAAVVNLDHSGRGGPLFAFELAPPNRGMLDALRAAAPEAGRLRAYSFAADVYRLLPFDTDFTVLRTLGVPGVNLAFAGDGYGYHTSLDDASAVPAASLATLTSVVDGLARELVVAGAPLGAGTDGAGYLTIFPVGGFTVGLGRVALWGLALVLLALAGAQLVGVLRREPRGVLRCWLALAVALPAAVAVLAVLVAALRALEGYDQVAYAHPWPFFALLAAAVFAVLLLAGRLAAERGAEAPVRLAAVTAPWGLLAAAAVLLAPGSAAFFLLPLAGLVAAAALSRRRRGPGATAAAALLALVAAFLAWAGPVAGLLPLLVTTVPKMGPEPLLFWPLALGLPATLLATVPWAFAGGRRARRGAWLGSAAAAAAALAAVLVLPAYDAARPQRAWRYHVSGGSAPYAVLASTDRLTGVAGARRGPGPDELFWIGPGWWRAVEHSEIETPPPRVQTLRSDGGVVIEVAPPPGADVVLLRLPRDGVEATAPPAPRRGHGPLTLRWVVAGGETARFVVRGALPAGARARVISVAPGLPEGLAEAPAPDRAYWLVGERTLAVAEVGISDDRPRDGPRSGRSRACIVQRRPVE